MRAVYLLSVLFFAGLLAGCCSSTETIKETTKVTDHTITVKPPAISDTLQTRTIRDTVYAEKIVRGDTVLKVIFTPKKELITVWAQPDSVRIVTHDTVRTKISETVYKPGFFERLWNTIDIAIIFYFLGVVSVVVLIILAKIKGLITI